MAKPGPSKGTGGRPRTKNPKARDDGYKRVSVGPKGKGKQVYQHRAVAGVGKGSKAGTEGVVHHKDHKRANNKRGNLAVVSKKRNRTD